MGEKALLDTVRDALRTRLSAESLRHSLAVADTAGSLAMRYGVDADAAHLAGLLHDWSRDESPKDLCQQAESAGITIYDVDQMVPYLLHGRVAAAVLADTFPGVGADILRAVERHTMGAVEMTDLDRIVYVADLIEPNRDFIGVEELRAAVATHALPELYALAYTASLMHLLRSRKHIHPTTVKVWNAIVGGED